MDAIAVNPISIDEFTAALETLNVTGTVALAVSGGRDSMALAVLAASLVRRDLQFIALTVDHGLRGDSATQAAQVASWCEALGLPCQVLRWGGAKPSTAVQATARHARYRLLIDAALTHGADTLLTAHTADDQAETIAMRSARSDAMLGLAGMRHDIQICAGASAAVRLVRPLLKFRREQTTQTLSIARQRFIDDPSNADDQFERVRIRRELTKGGAVNNWLALGAKMRARADRSRAMETNLFAALGGAFFDWGGASIAQPQSAALEDAHFVSLLARLVRAVGADDHRPGDAAINRLVTALHDRKPQTLGGVLIRSYEGKLWFFREPAALLGREGVPALVATQLLRGRPVLWDRRFLISTTANSPLFVKPLGALGDLTGVPNLLENPPSGARLGVPGVFSSGTLICAPGCLSAKGSNLTIKALNRERFSDDVLRFS